MTKCGMICLIALMTASLIGLVLCSIKQGGAGRRGRGEIRKGEGEPQTVSGEPVKFRCGELRFANCRASMELSPAWIEGHGFSMDRKGVERAAIYARKELAYLLADQAIEAGAIRYELDGGIFRAEMKVVMPEVAYND